MKKYITPDIDNNVTNGWKMFDRKGNRMELMTVIEQD
jgi:filamentous hemagglutinin